MADYIDQAKQCLDNAIALLKQEVHDDLAAWIGRLDADCKSEIEKLLGIAVLIQLGVGYGKEVRLAIVPALEHSNWDKDVLSRFHRRIDFVVPQVPIGRFVADFVVRRAESVYIGKPEFLAPVVLECDGHDFHEKTKEQAAHDRNRDREMTLAGYRVLRFTGSEIWNRPAKCAEQVADLLDKQAGEYLNQCVALDVRESEAASA